MSNLITKLSQLCMLNGISGQEKNVTNYIKKELEKDVDVINYDNLGSLILSKGEKGPKIMIAGHVDEIGLIVSEITKEGFIKFQTIGGWYSSVMLAQLWQIQTDKNVVYGVTGSRPPHVISFNERLKSPDIKSMFLDIGVANKEEAENLGIKIGDMITPYMEFRTLSNDNYLLGKGLDNRVGALVVMEVLKNLKITPNRVFGVFTVQEEVGLRGAKTSTNKICPQIAIAVDTGIGDDIPGGENKPESALGLGPQITVYDGGLLAHQGLRHFILKIAKENNIPFRQSVALGGRTDAAEMHLMNEGAASITLSVPTRYIHSHTSIVHKQDILYTIKLLTLLLEKLDEKTVNNILFN